ncbi:MAG: hypothetical protein QNJ63_29610 [Calothrix sp. MO_192.B10]|nr:hypothetical protein [Calothrix sp. MO_192.B10]
MLDTEVNYLDSLKAEVEACQKPRIQVHGRQRKSWLGHGDLVRLNVQIFP